MSDSLSTFSKYIPAKPDKKHAARAALNPMILDCSGKCDLTCAFSVEDNCTIATPAAKITNASHCHFLSCLFNTTTAKNAVVNILS